MIKPITPPTRSGENENNVFEHCCYMSLYIASGKPLFNKPVKTRNQLNGKTNTVIKRKHKITMKKNVNVKLNEEIVKFYVEKAKKNDTTVSHEIRQIIKKDYEKELDK